MNIKSLVVGFVVATALVGCHAKQGAVRVEHANESDVKSVRFDVAQPKTEYVLCDKCEQRTRKVIAPDEQISVVNEQVITKPVIDDAPVVKEQLVSAKQQYVVHFDFDKSKTNKDETINLVKFIKTVSKDGDFLIKVNGDADPVGTLKYNKKLSLKRAAFVKHVMVKAGIDPTKIKTSIEQPCCQGSVADNAEAQSQKRKATINIVYGDVDGNK